MAFTVCMQSSLGRKPCRVHAPFDKAAMITARCEMLLSPGTAISMSIRGARLIRSSIDELLNFLAERALHSCAEASIGYKRVLSSLPLLNGDNIKSFFKLTFFIGN